VVSKLHCDGVAAGRGYLQPFPILMAAVVSFYIPFDLHKGFAPNRDAPFFERFGKQSYGEIVQCQRVRQAEPDGFSAGGYVICLWNTEKGYPAFHLPKPQACFPIYPVTSYRLMDAEGEQDWGDGNDKDEFAMSGVGCTMQEACNSCFEIPMHVEGFPPTAIFLAAEDELVNPEHSKLLARALEAAHIPCRLEIGPNGGHGFADGEGMCMEGWPQRAIEWYEGLK